MNILNKLLFLITGRNYLITADGPSTFGVVFRNGDIFMVDGVRIDAIHFTCHVNDVRCLTAHPALLQRDNRFILGILQEELTRRGMVIGICEN